MKASSQWTFTSFDIYVFEGFSCEFMTHLCYQLEACPKTKKPHLQGFIKFSRHIRIRQLQRILGNYNLHAEPSRGSPLENRTYCTKIETRVPNTDPVIIGFNWSNIRQGKRTDLEILVDMVRQGMTDYQIMESDPKSYLRYNTHIRKVRFTHLSRTLPDYSPCFNTVYYGKSRTGKTRQAFTQAGKLGDTFKVTFAKDFWLDGYDGQKSLIIDEFDGQIPIQNLLTLLDNYKLQCPVKGGFVYRQWTHIFITSNLHPEEWYPEAHAEHLDALKNRLHQIVTMVCKSKLPECKWNNVKMGKAIVLPFPTSGQDLPQAKSAAFTFKLPPLKRATLGQTSKCRDLKGKEEKGQSTGSRNSRSRRSRRSRVRLRNKKITNESHG